MKTQIYVAYGSNMNVEQMKRRCPNAKPIGKYILGDYKLEFRGVANIIKCKGKKVPVALWEITEECEKSLDIYEGYPRLYRKEYVKVEYEFKDYKGHVIIDNTIIDEKQIRDICIEDYLENNLKIIKNSEKKEGN